MGYIGNNIFFVCTAWFLIGKKESANKKAFNLICTVWFISIIYLAIIMFTYSGDIGYRNIMYSVLPTTFGNNWYITCYIVFLFIYPFINRIIETVSQKELLFFVLTSTAMWIIIDFLIYDYPLFFPSFILLWISIYCLMAYLKLYCPATLNSTKVGITLIIIGALGTIGQVVITNYYLLHPSFLVLRSSLSWNTNSCPFYILIAIGGLILALKMKFKSRIVNYISSLSLLVYLIHENILFRTFVRPLIWQNIFQRYGYSKLLFWDLGYSIALFIAAIIVSAIYKETMQKLVSSISEELYKSWMKIYGAIENRIMKIK